MRLESFFELQEIDDRALPHPAERDSAEYELKRMNARAMGMFAEREVSFSVRVPKAAVTVEANNSEDAIVSYHEDFYESQELSAFNYKLGVDVETSSISVDADSVDLEATELNALIDEFGEDSADDFVSVRSNEG